MNFLLYMMEFIALHYIDVATNIGTERTVLAL